MSFPRTKIRLRIKLRLQTIRLRIISALMNTMRHIRTSVFRVTQAEFGRLAGVGQATVSRWEGGVAPSLEEMQAIRKAAFERGIDWDDRLFFEAPENSEEAA